MTDNLETLAEVGKCMLIAVPACIATFGILAGVTGLIDNATSLYSRRKTDFEDQKKGYPSRDYKLEEPSRWQAFKDAAKFEWAYVRSLGKVNTTNYDFDKALKDGAEPV